MLGDASKSSGARQPVAGKTFSGVRPPQVAGRVKLEGALEISPERICQLVRENRRQGGRLHRQLTQGGRMRVRRAGRSGRDPAARGQIAERPAEATARAGDWVADTVIGGKHRGALVPLVGLPAGEAG